VADGGSIGGKAARTTLCCAPLNSYLHAVTVPFSGGQAISHCIRAFTYTTVQVGANTVAAEYQLCK